MLRRYRSNSLSHSLSPGSHVRAGSSDSRLNNIGRIQPVDREGTALFFNEPEPHGFWLAKNWVDF
jgi:hypothetical protein